MTVVSELPLTEDQLKELATKLKNTCGTGGTAKDGRIEIQGDQRDRIAAELEKLGYKVKRGRAGEQLTALRVASSNEVLARRPAADHAVLQQLGGDQLHRLPRRPHPPSIASTFASIRSS